MRQIGAILIGLLFGLIAAAIFAYSFMDVARAFVGGGETIYSKDIWVFLCCISAFGSYTWSCSLLFIQSFYFE